MKGMIVNVYRHSGGHGDSTNGGATADADEVLLVGPGVPEMFGPRDGMPVLRYVDRPRYGPIAVPVEGRENAAGPMFGGNFVYASDTRFPSAQPIPVHDRFETWADYERMSR